MIPLLAETQLPAEFIRRYENLVPPATRDDFFAACTSPLRPALRVNSLKTTTSLFQKLAATHGWQLDPISWSPLGFQLSSEQTVTKSLEFFCGLAYLQEAASQIPPLVLDPQPGDWVLDMAAAPGSKTTQMAAMMKNQGLLLANDKDIKRISSLVFNLEKYGVTHSLISTVDANELGNRLTETFDKVLLDAPCSAEGAARKDTDYFKQWQPQKILTIANVQRSLLLSALKCCKVGGTIVYSTCTLAPEENEANVNWLLQNYGDSVKLADIDLSLPFSPGITQWQAQTFAASLTKTVRILPHQAEVEAFFVAKLVKTAALPGKDLTTPKPSLNPFEKYVRPKDRSHILALVQDRFGIDAATFAGFELTQIKESTWLKPTGWQNVANHVRIDRAGLPLGEIYHGHLRISYPFSLTYGHLATQNTIAITAAQANEYIHGRDIYLDPTQTQNATTGQIILTNAQKTLGRGLLQDQGKVKNQVKKAWVVF